MDHTTGERTLELAERQLREAIKVTDAPTQRALQPSLERALDAIEEACPAVVQITAVGLMTAYGPREDLASCKRLILVATATKAVILGTDDVVSPLDRRFSGAVFWGAVHQLIRKSDLGPLATAVLYRMGETLTLADQRFAPAKALGAIPLIVAIAGRGRKPREYCGLIGMIGLPPAVHVQLASQEAVGEPKH